MNAQSYVVRSPSSELVEPVRIERGAERTGIERRCAWVEVDQDRSGKCRDRDREQAVVVGIKPLRLADPCRARQRPVEPVDPGVVRARESRRRATSRGEWRAAVAADIEEGTQAALAGRARPAPASAPRLSPRTTRVLPRHRRNRRPPTIDRRPLPSHTRGGRRRSTTNPATCVLSTAAHRDGSRSWPSTFLLTDESVD